MKYATIPLALIFLLTYLRLVRRYDARRKHRFERWHCAASFGCVLATLVALEPPVEPLTDVSFAYHMLQHMLLIYVAAPLFLLGAPTMLLFGSTDQPVRSTLAKFLSSWFWRWVTFPVFSWLLFSAVLWGTHFSPLYQAALNSAWLHVLEHGLYLFSAILFWQAIIHIGPAAWPMNFPLRIVYVFAAMPQSAFLGLALFQTRRPLYDYYVGTQGSAPAALADQHNGAALMWILGGLLLFAVFMLVAAMWGRHERQLGEQLDRAAMTRIGALPLVVLVSVLPVVIAHPANAGSTNQEGRFLYQVHCSSCHGLRLEGSTSAPPLVDVNAAQVDFYVGTGRMPATVPYQQQLHRTPIFSQQQISGLIDYLTAVSHGSRKVPHIEGSGDLERGRTLFMANCAACHGAAASGGSVGYGWVAPSLRNATPTQIAEAVRIGPGVMPRFDSKTLSDRDLNDIMHYAHALQAGAPHPGGLALGDIGPVAEGAVAWIFGIGILMFVVRKIGTSA